MDLDVKGCVPFKVSSLIELTMSRCTRLNKDCQPSDTRRRRAVNKTPVTKVDRLEEKLDGLVTLLKTATQNGNPVEGSNVASASMVQNQLTPESLQSLAPSPGNSENREPGRLLRGSTDLERDLRYCPGTGIILHVPVIDPNATYSASGTRSVTYHSPQASALLEFEPTTEEAEEYLKAYLQFKSAYFPLIGFPTTITAKQLRQERPLLWLCIMMICTKSSEQQKVLSREIRLAVGREMLLEGKNNFDLLLGLLVFSAW